MLAGFERTKALFVVIYNNKGWVQAVDYICRLRIKRRVVMITK